MAHQLWHISYGILVMALLVMALLGMALLVMALLVMAYQLWHIGRSCRTSRSTRACRHVECRAHKRMCRRVFYMCTDVCVDVCFTCV